MDKIISGIIIAALIGVTGFLTNSNYRDIRESKKAEKTINNLRELRVALEKYYQLTGNYPDLSLYGAKDDLKKLDYVDEKGKVISFAEIYGRNTIPTTPKTETFEESNEVFNTKNFENGTEKGGWNYDYINYTGEIHANLAENSYYQEIKWNEY